MSVDITFDFRNDANGGDPDKCSNTLRQYHKILWSKKLPNGKVLNLIDNIEDVYLYYKSDFDEYYLSSDSTIHTYSKWIRMQYLIKQIPENDIIEFLNKAYTIGGFIIFPGNRINNLPTINQERGCNTKINDRFDLTLECIKRFFEGKLSPLYDTIKRYENYFKLFIDFKGFCEFFFLQDLTFDNFTKIDFFLPFDDFKSNPCPTNINEYFIYKNNSINFVNSRNKRIENYNKR